MWIRRVKRFNTERTEKKRRKQRRLPRRRRGHRVNRKQLLPGPALRDRPLQIHRQRQTQRLRQQRPPRKAGAAGMKRLLTDRTRVTRILRQSTMDTASNERVVETKQPGSEKGFTATWTRPFAQAPSRDDQQNQPRNTYDRSVRPGRMKSSSNVSHTNRGGKPGYEQEEEQVPAFPVPTPGCFVVSHWNKKCHTSGRQSNDFPSCAQNTMRCDLDAGAVA
jgi:hypothetical protein